MIFAGRRRDRKDVLAGIVLFLAVFFAAILAPSSCAPVYAVYAVAPDGFTAVPEPSTYGLGAAGLLVVAVIWKRRRAR